MKKLWMIFALVIGVGGNGFGQTINVQVDPNTSSAVSKTISLVSQGGDAWGLSGPTWGAWDGVSFYNQTTIDGSTANTQFNSDPTIHYALGVTKDTSSTQTYTLTFSLPLTTTLLAGEQVLVSSSISGSVADGDGNGVEVGLALNTPYIQQAYIGSVDAGVDLLNQPLTFGPTDTMSFGPDPSAATPNTTGETLSANANSLTVVTSFTLSANDSASFSGKFLVTPVATSVPEPSEEVLLVAGVLVLFVAVLRRRRMD
jgi:hypothetical protein